MKVTIEYRNPSELIPYKRNSRKHSEEQIKQIEDSLQRFKINKPVVIDEHDVILCGHGLVIAANNLDIDVPTVKLTHLTEDEKKAYILADNKIALNSTWDDDLLLQELQTIDCSDIDLTLTGFTVDEYSKLFDDESEPVNDIEDIEEFNIIISCTNEDQQQTLYDELSHRQLNVRLMS